MATGEAPAEVVAGEVLVTEVPEIIKTVRQAVRILLLFFLPFCGLGLE